MTGRRRALQLILGMPACALAQQKPRLARIGYLHLHTIEKNPTPERAAFLAGLRELGYEVGRNLIIDYRGAEGDLGRLSELAEELVKLRPEAIVVGSVEAAAAAKAATNAIPLIITAAGDPVHSGLVKSYARPGGNLTGLSFISPELGAKRIELVKEILPKARRIAVIWNARDSTSEREWDQAREAARALGLDVDPEPMREPADLARTLESLPRERPHAILVIVDARMVGFRKIIGDAAVKARIACVAGWRGFVEHGAVASYSPDFRVLWHRAAYYVDRILKGARPHDLPVEQPSKFELVVNLKAAAAIGIAVPKTVVLRADEVIE